MAEFLSKDTEAILKKYDQAKPFDNVNGIEFVAVDKKDLDFLLGYAEGSLVIEEDLREKVERYEKVLKEIAEVSKVSEGSESADLIANELIDTAKEALEG